MARRGRVDHGKAAVGQNDGPSVEVARVIRAAVNHLIAEALDRRPVQAGGNAKRSSEAENAAHAPVYRLSGHTQTMTIRLGSLSLPVHSPTAEVTNFTSYWGWASSHSLIC